MLPTSAMHGDISGDIQSLSYTSQKKQLPRSGACRVTRTTASNLPDRSLSCALSPDPRGLDP